jgi:hypothetical protein
MGDVCTNLDVLGAGDKPEDPFSSRMWQLYHTPDFPKGQLHEALLLLREVGWTSLVCEQQHGSLAQLRRRHPEYSIDTLISRALMHNCIRLLPSTSPEEKKLATLSKKMYRIYSKDPTKVSPTSILHQALMHVAKANHQECIGSQHMFLFFYIFVSGDDCTVCVLCWSVQCGDV